jgi:hypothetical protein
MAGVAKETVELITLTAEHAEQVSNLAAKYQISTDAVQRYQEMSRRTGIDVASFGDAIVNISKQLDKKPEMFARWGFDVEHLRSLKPDELLGAMAEKLETLNQADRITMAKELMKSVDLLPVLLDGFSELEKQAQKFGVAVVAADVSNLKGLKTQIEDLTGAWHLMWAEFGVTLAKDPEVQAMFGMLTDGIIGLAKALHDHKEDFEILKVLASFAVGGPVAAAKQAVASMGFRANTGGATGSWDLNPGADRTESAEDRKARLAAEKEAAKEAAALRKKDADAELEFAFERNDLLHKYLTTRLEIIQKEEDHARFLEAKLATDARGSSMGDPKAANDAFFASLDAGHPELSHILPGQSAGPAIPQTNLANAAAAAMGLVIDKKEKQLTLDKAIEQALLGQHFTHKQIQEAMGKTVDAQMTWFQFAQSTANQLTSMGQTGSAIGKVLGGIGGIGSMFQKDANGANAFSGGLGSFKGLAGGLSAAFAAFDIGKTLYTMFHKTEAQKVAFDVGRDYGVQISEGLSKTIAESSKTIGREAASLLSLDKIIGEAGGVSAFGLDKTLGKMHDLFSMMETGKLTAQQLQKPFDALFGDVAQQSISKTTGLISEQARQIMGMGIDAGLNGDGSAIRKFQDQQHDLAATYLERLAKNNDFNLAGTAAGAAFGAALVAEYQRLVDQGLSGSEIADKLGPQIDAWQKKLSGGSTKEDVEKWYQVYKEKLKALQDLQQTGATLTKAQLAEMENYAQLLAAQQKKLDTGDFGSGTAVGGGAAFDQMMEKLQLFQSELTGPTAQAIQDTIGLAGALYNSGDLSKESFQGLAEQVGQEFDQLKKKMIERRV